MIEEIILSIIGCTCVIVGILLLLQNQKKEKVKPEVPKVEDVKNHKKKNGESVFGQIQKLDENLNLLKEPKESKKRVATSLLIFLLALSMLPCVHVHAPVMPHIYSFDLPCYAPAKITFNYASTNNHSIYDISTYGSGAYLHTGSAKFMEFQAKDPDDYWFTLTLIYNAAFNQTILIGIWSGTLPVQGLNMFSIFEDVTFRVHLRVTTQPSYPSEEAVAAAVVQQVHKDLIEQQQFLINTINQQNAAIMTGSILSVFVSACSVVAMLLVLFALRSKRRNP